MRKEYIQCTAKRHHRIKIFTKSIELLNKLREVRGLSAAQSQQLIQAIQELKALHRIERSETDILYFAFEYFSEDRNPGNGGNLIPLGVSIEDAPQFHQQLTEMLHVVSNKEIDKRIAWSAPRGHAKSAYLSNIFPLHQCVFHKRNYILVISETDSAAKTFVEWVGNELKHNEKLRRDFGELLSPQKQMNGRDNQEAFLTNTGILVEAASIGKQLRGKRNGSHRPDLVICDDLESSKNTNTKDLIEKNIHWFNSVVIPIGDPQKTAFVYMGTAMVSEGLLQHVMKRSDFSSKRFAAIVADPERGDLWDGFETILRDSENMNRKEEAISFYDMHQEEMDKGIEVLWLDGLHLK